MTVKGGSVEELLTTSYAQPYVQIFYNVTQSTSGATSLTALMFILLMFGIMNQVTTASRQLWSFAQDKGIDSCPLGRSPANLSILWYSGLPWSTFLSRVQPGWHVPLNAVVVTLLFSIIVSTIILGSPVAFFTLASLCNAGLFASYLICIGCVAWRCLAGEPLLPRKFDLGRFGLPINLAAMAFRSVQFVFTFFPTAPHPTMPNMNWTILVFGVVIILALIYYQLHAKRDYQGPVMYVRKSA